MNRPLWGAPMVWTRSQGVLINCVCVVSGSVVLGGEHKVQGHQTQQGAAAGGASVVLLGHRQATLRWRFRHCPQHQSGALPAPLLEEPTMRNSHE